MAKEIIWTDKETGQKFIIDDSGEKIFILGDGTRVYESDLILEEMLREYEEYEEERKREEEAEEAFRREEEEQAIRELEEAEMEEEEEEAIYWYYYGPGSDDWNEEG